MSVASLLCSGVYFLVSTTLKSLDTALAGLMIMVMKLVTTAILTTMIKTSFYWILTMYRA